MLLKLKIYRKYQKSLKSDFLKKSIFAHFLVKIDDKIFKIPGKHFIASFNFKQTFFQ
jgi:hypothetical protein